MDRAAVSGLTISIGGLLNITGNLIKPTVVNAGKAEVLTSVCPHCEQPHKVKQYYQCTQDPTHSGFTIGECHKAKQDNDLLIKVSDEDVKAAKESDLPKKRIDVNIHRRSDVEAHVIPDGNSYVFVPDNPKEMLYGVVLDYLKQNPDYVLLGMVNIRADKCVSINLGLNSQLVVQEIAWPEDLREFETPEYETSGAASETAASIMEKLVSDFDATEYRKKSRERIAALTGEGVVEEKKVETVDDLETALLGILEKVS